MVDPAQIQLEKVLLGVQGVERIAELHARRLVALLAVAVAFAGTVLVAFFAGQLSGPSTVVLEAGAFTMGGWQVHGLHRLAERVQRTIEDALDDVESLMPPEEEA